MPGDGGGGVFLTVMCGELYFSHSSHNQAWVTHSCLTEMKERNTASLLPVMQLRGMHHCFHLQVLFIRKLQIRIDWDFCHDASYALSHNDQLSRKKCSSLLRHKTKCPYYRKTVQKEQKCLNYTQNCLNYLQICPNYMQYFQDFLNICLN